MAAINKLFKNVSQQLTAESVSWGSLMMWVTGLAVMIMLMVFFSHNY